MLLSDSVIVIVEKLLPFKVSFLLVIASFRRRHVSFVLGETGRTLATRMKDHTSHNTQPTAVGDHCREHGHVINKNNVEVLAREEGWFKRKIREAIEIKTLQPTINRDQGFDLPAIYSEILSVSVTRDRSRQTSGHPAQVIGAVASSSQTKET